MAEGLMSCSLAEFTKSWITARGAEDREGERERRRGAGGKWEGGVIGAHSLLPGCILGSKVALAKVSVELLPL